METTVKELLDDIDNMTNLSRNKHLDLDDRLDLISGNFLYDLYLMFGFYKNEESTLKEELETIKDLTDPGTHVETVLENGKRVQATVSDKFDLIYQSVEKLYELLGYEE